MEKNNITAVIVLLTILNFGLLFGCFRLYAEMKANSCCEECQCERI